MRILVLCAALAALATPLALAAPTQMKSELYATLTGKVEVPKGSPTGKGTAEITLDAAKGSVCWQLKYSGIGKPVAAHIHRAPAGKSGPVLVPFGKTFKPKGCTSAPKATIRGILTRPAGYYVNLHTPKYPGGAIRGQLTHKSS